MEREPDIYSRERFKRDHEPVAGINGRWYIARPASYRRRWLTAMVRRFKVAFKVFTGEWDALKWGGGQ